MKRQFPVSDSSPAAIYLKQIRRRIDAIRAQIPHFTDLGKRMAKPLLAGGSLFAASIAPYFPSEFCGRAGGLMGVKTSHDGTPGKRDIAYFALPDPRFWKPGEDDALRELLASSAMLFAVGRPDELPPNLRKRIAGFTGGALSADGGYALESLRPLTSFRAFEHLVRSWITTGEMITACIRSSKMPTIWMSVWLEGALERNASFYDHDNLREPWHVPLFHDRCYIPPLDPGYAASAFLDELSRIHARLLAQGPKLARAGEWMAQAHRAGRGVHAVAVGHCHPQLLNLQQTPNYPIRWGNSMSDLNKAVPAKIGKGDVALHLGYSPVNVDDVRRILRRGVKFIYSSPYGRPAALKDHPNLLWLDLPWRPADATVDIPGYSVRILPTSSSIHSMTYNAILSEFAERMDWR
jgi:hypothetical protein